jgi:acyl-homoserine lactone acylase PvdQ
MCYYIILKNNMNLAAWVKIILGMVVISVLGFYLCLADNYVSTLTHEGETIQIWRDELGIPLVTAPSFKAAMYGWGYVTAEDRLFQISFRRLLLQGRLG